MYTYYFAEVFLVKLTLWFETETRRKHSVFSSKRERDIHRFSSKTSRDRLETEIWRPGLYACWTGLDWTGLDWTGLDHHHCWRLMTWLSDTIVLHSSRSCAILVHSATDDPIQSLMSSVHRLLGRPRRFLPLIQPWRTAVHTLSALAVCPKNCNFRRWMSFRSRISSPISSIMDWFVRCSFQLIRNMRQCDVISKALILFLSLAFKVHVSHPYVATGHTSNFIKRAFSSLHITSYHVMTLAKSFTHMCLCRCSPSFGTTKRPLWLWMPRGKKWPSTTFTAELATGWLPEDRDQPQPLGGIAYWSFPSQIALQGGAEIDTSLYCEDVEPPYIVVCVCAPFAAQMSLILITLARRRMARLSWPGWHVVYPSRY